MPSLYNFGIPSVAIMVSFSFSKKDSVQTKGKAATPKAAAEEEEVESKSESKKGRGRPKKDSSSNAKEETNNKSMKVVAILPQDAADLTFDEFVTLWRHAFKKSEIPSKECWEGLEEKEEYYYARELPKLILQNEECYYAS